MTLAACFLRETTERFLALMTLAERALDQVTTDDLFVTLDDEANSLALLMKHLAGNMRSRWTDFLTTDGEKPDRARDTEFLLTDADTPTALRARWETAWQLVFDTLAALTEADLLGTVTIRGEAHPALGAIQRNLAHTAYHVGQMVMLAKYLRGADWSSLSIPRGESEAFLADMRARHGGPPPA